MGLFGGGKKTIGLDIGSGLIKLVVIDHSGSEPELVKVAFTPVLADAIVEGEVMDPGIDADAFALHNAFEVNYPDEQTGLMGLLNIGHEATNINILEDGVPILTRDLAIGTRKFREDLQRERGLSAEDAEKLLQAPERSET